MKVAVFDSYAKKSNGNIAHFDILVPENTYSQEEILDFGREYLKGLKEDAQALTSDRCKFCHIEKVSQEVLDSINKQGYYILEMEDIPKIK